MKHAQKGILVIMLVMLWLPMLGQDVITKTNGDDIHGKIIKITQKNIKYRLSNSEDSSVHSVPKAKVFSVKYENGVTEVFNETHVDDYDQEGHWDKRSMKQQGREDARDNYRKYRGAKAATVWTTIVTDPIVGLIPAIACSSTQPNDKHLDYPDETLMQNKEYAKAYRKEAKRIKQGKVWGSWGLGTGIYAVAVIILLVL